MNKGDRNHVKLQDFIIFKKKRKMIIISWASNGCPVHTRQIYSDKLQNFVFARISLIRLDAIGINPDKN